MAVFHQIPVYMADTRQLSVFQTHHILIILTDLLNFKDLWLNNSAYFKRVPIVYVVDNADALSEL